MMKEGITILLGMLLLFLFFFKGNAQSNTNTIDSLQHLLKTARADSNKAKLLIALGDACQYENNDLPASKYYYLQAGKLSRQIHYTAGIFEYLFDYTDILIEQGLYDSALILNQEAQALAAREKDSTRLIRAFFNLGVSYSGLENYRQAISYFLQAKDFYEKKGMMDKVGMCDNELMILFRETKQYVNAIRYGQEAITLYRKYRPPVKVAIPLQNLSVVYQSMQQPEKAAPLLKQALAINKKYNDEYGELNVTINLLDLMFHLNEPDDLKPYIDRTLLLARKMKDKEAVCDGLLSMGTYYMWHNQLSLAHTYADSALQVAEQTGINELKQACYLVLSHISYAERKYSAAIKYDEQLDLTQQEINTANINHSIIDLQTKYETKKKEAQIKELRAYQQLQELSLQKKRIYIIVMIVIIAALLIIGSLYYHNHKRRQQLLLAEQQLQQQKITALEQEKQLMATEAVMQGQEEERSRLARDLHDGLGGILSSARYSLYDMKENMIITQENAMTFERTLSMLDKSISELRRVAHNMMPEALMNQALGDALGDFCSHVSSTGMLQIDYDDFGMDKISIDNSIKIMVYRIIQELVNNIIRHAKAISAIVQVIVKDNVMDITVEDDGKGFDINELDQAAGIGYKNIKSRVGYLKGKIDIHSQAAKGTSVYIAIPL